jgi:hypothetical protein
MNLLVSVNLFPVSILTQLIIKLIFCLESTLFGR